MDNQAAFSYQSLDTFVSALMVAGLAVAGVLTAGFTGVQAVLA